MSTWVYLASHARANESDTLRFALTANAIVRTARNVNGNLVACVGRLAPGDEVLLAYRDGRPFIARVRGRIAKVSSPVTGTKVIEALSGRLAQELIQAGYPALHGGTVEVFHIEDVRSVSITLRGAYRGNNAIHRLDPADAAGFGPREEPASGASPTTSDAEWAAPLAGTERNEISTPGGPVFAAYMMVDWSSSSTPCRGANSVWIGCGVRNGGGLLETEENPPTRAAALAWIRSTLTGWVKDGKRCLVGLDFAFGYPRGFSKALGLANPGWRGTLTRFGQGVMDSAGNVHNRDAFAADCNQQISKGPGPFWGCHNGATNAFLTTRRVGVFAFPHAGLDEYRTTDVHAAHIATVQSVWKLNQGVSVGGQTILGLKYVAALRDVPPLGASIQLWPFETGWTAGKAPVLLCEIFPSVVSWDPTLKGVADRIQVLSCVRHAAREDAAGILAARFHAPTGLSASENAAALSEEGWILFVP